MAIGSTNSTNAPLAGPGPERPSTTTPTGNSQLGKNEFVKLMMAQLANQDPTAPQSSEAFVAQLAQFATLESMQAQQGTLESILMAQAAANQTAVAGLVGKDVSFRTDHVALEEGTATPLTVTVPGHADTVTVTIKDEDGHVVRSLQYQDVDGDAEVQWDGKDAHGEPLPDGSYQVEVVANEDQHAVDATVAAHGHVDGVTFVDGAPLLLVGSLKIPLADVVSFFDPNADAFGGPDAATDVTPPDPSTPASRNPASLSPSLQQLIDTFSGKPKTWRPDADLTTTQGIRLPTSKTTRPR